MTLIGNGADVNLADNKGSTPLYCAVSKGYKTICDILITYGALVNGADKNRAPLHVAVVKGNTSICKLLLKYNCFVNNTNDEGLSPLHVAA